MVRALASGRPVGMASPSYVSRPRAATPPLAYRFPKRAPHIGSWLRLKGVRDIASGLAVLAFMVWGGSHMVGIILLVEAHHPIVDMLVILAAKGSASGCVDFIPAV